jgi:hypothetical protein
VATQSESKVGAKKRGRPNLLQKLAENHPRALKHLGRNDVILPMKPQMMEKFKAVLKQYKAIGNVVKACEEAGVKESTFYVWLRKYAEARELAKKYGLGIKGDPSVRVINAKPPPLKDEESCWAIFGCGKEWTPERKQEALKQIMEALKVGTPFLYAVRYAGISKAMLEDWILEEPQILDVLLQAEAGWAVTFFKCLTTGMIEASKQGKLVELVKAAERRFATQWGQVQAIDVTLKKEDASKDVLEGNSVIETSFEKEMRGEG